MAVTTAGIAIFIPSFWLSIYHYIYDRVAGTFELPDLADIITQRAAQLSLGASWDPA